MPNYFFTDSDGTRRGPLTEERLQTLVERGIILPTTPLETDGGHKGLAGQIPGLKFNNALPPPSRQPAQTAAPPPPANLFCTNCGNPIAEHAIACMSCGARPTGHKKFCRHCGVALNPEQVICIKCGAGISTVSVSRSIGGGGRAGTPWQKNKLVAGLLGIFLGHLGAHKFYMGSWGWGIVFVAAVFLTFFIGWFVTAIIGLVEGIMFLVMSEETFAEKYPAETEHPFRW